MRRSRDIFPIQFDTVSGEVKRRNEKNFQRKKEEFSNKRFRDLVQIFPLMTNLEATEFDFEGIPLAESGPNIAKNSCVKQFCQN